MGIQVDEGGGWKNELWAELRSERGVKSFQEVRAHPWLLERRNGLARGIFNRLKEDRSIFGQTDPRGATVVPEHSHLGRRVFLLPDGFWVQSGGSLWVGGQG